jgi:hypothetical protein
MRKRAICAFLAVCALGALTFCNGATAACKIGCYYYDWFSDNSADKDWHTNANVCITYANSPTGGVANCVVALADLEGNCGNLAQVTRYPSAGIRCCSAGGHLGQSEPGTTTGGTTLEMKNRCSP